MNEQKIDEHLIRISAGKIPIDQAIDMGDDVTLQVEGTVVKIEDSDNQDGTINRTYVVKGVAAGIITA